LRAACPDQQSLLVVKNLAVDFPFAFASLQGRCWCKFYAVDLVIMAYYNKKKYF